MFQHTAARRRLAAIRQCDGDRIRRFNTQPPEGGWETISQKEYALLGFNTQPPEGGWVATSATVVISGRFQHTAARRRLVSCGIFTGSTSGFNTQPPEGGWLRHRLSCYYLDKVSTHSRPKAAGFQPRIAGRDRAGFNTQPPEGGWLREGPHKWRICKFQHTAARRRLDEQKSNQHYRAPVSTHSRPKAAGFAALRYVQDGLFQHTAARRRLGKMEASKNDR